MHFDKHESRGFLFVFFFLQQMPYLLKLEFVLSHQIPDDPKTLIIYSLLLKGNVICRTDLTVTPGVRLFRCYFLASSFTICINYNLFFICPRNRLPLQDNVSQEEHYLSLLFCLPAFVVIDCARRCARNATCLLLSLPKGLFLLTSPSAVYR